MQCSDFTLGLDNKLLKAEWLLGNSLPGVDLKGGIIMSLGVKAESPNKYSLGENLILALLE